jgi:hypothetical protein
MLKTAQDVALAIVRKYAPQEEPALKMISEDTSDINGTLSDAPGQFGFDPLTGPLFAAVVVPVIFEYSKEFGKHLADKTLDLLIDAARQKLRMNRKTRAGELTDAQIDEIVHDINKEFSSDED